MIFFFCLNLKLFYLISFLLLLFKDPATTEIYTLSLHDALPISARRQSYPEDYTAGFSPGRPPACLNAIGSRFRSEEHTSELQSRGQLVCRLLLEKKNSHSRQTRRHGCETRCTPFSAATTLIPTG